MPRPKTFSTPPGMPCPECEARITVTIEALLSPEALVCPSCGLELRVDRERSEKSLDGLRKLQDVMRDVEAAKGGAPDGAWAP